MPEKTGQHWVRAEEEARNATASRGSIAKRPTVKPEEEARHQAPDTRPAGDDPWEQREEAKRRNPMPAVPPPNPD